ncbi:hypothetical protein B0H14DRAFT_2709269 [Mycena olivaceomarginata]|nr:hypothetical protein B0H14DRAFT_2709269 [Mycena olivaceomarginata]
MTWDIKAGCMGKPEYESTAHLLSCFPDVPLTVPEYLEQRNARQNKLWPMVPLLPAAHKGEVKVNRCRNRLLNRTRNRPPQTALTSPNIPMAVATSSRRTTFELKTGHLGEVFDCFDGKVPEPDIFLAAARKLLGRDVGPADADATPTQLAERRKGLVFEDSIPGMQAGKCAGMSAAFCWVPDANLLGVEYSGEEKADQTLKSLDDFVPEQWGLPPYTQ